MEIVLMPTALEDLAYWKSSGSTIILKRIRQLIESIQQDPYSGIGKPERLKHQWADWWSRRINDVHRLIYRAEPNKVIIYSMRYHY